MSRTVTDRPAPAPDRPSRTRPGPVAAAPPLPRIDGLDGLRVVAAVGVVVYHAMGVWLPPNHVAGVVIPAAAFTFFILSGFVIYRPFAAADLARTAPPDTGRFIRSRLVRVLPLWWVAVAVYLLVGGTAELETPRDWLTTLLLLQYLDADLRFAVIGPAWALSVEWLFYLTAPALAFGVARLRRSFPAGRRDPATGQLVVLAVMGATAAAIGTMRPFAAVIAGMALAVVDLQRRRRRRAPGWLRVARRRESAVAVTIVAWVVLARYPYRDGLSAHWIQQDPVVTLVWMVTAAAWFIPVAFAGTPRVLSTRPLVWASQLTFGIYLWHDLALQRAAELLGTDGNFAAGLYLTAVGAVAITLVTYAVIERPIASLKHRVVGLGLRRAPRRPPERRPRPPSRPAGEGHPSAPQAPPAGADPARRPAAVAAAPPTPATARPSATGTGAATPDVVATRPADAGRGPRPGQDRRWLTSLDGLRVAAAWFVVSFHVFAEHGVPSWVSQTWAGMFVPIFALFFVMSGFILYRPWAVAHAAAALTGAPPGGRPPDGGAVNFWLRRLLRLYPLYWVVQATSLLTRGTGEISGPMDWFQVITLFPLPNYDIIIHHGLGVVVWTIMVELAFYALLPLYGRAVLAAVHRGVGFLASQIVPMAAVFSLLAYLGTSGFRLMLVACCIVLGMAFAAADAWQQVVGRPIRALRRLAVSPTFLAVVVVSAWMVAVPVSRGDDVDLLFHSYLPVHLAVMVVVSSAFFIPAVFGRPASPYRRVLSSRFVRFVGPLTFGVYLWHYPVIRVVPDTLDLPLVALWVWGVAGAVMMAWLTHHVIERPTNRIRHRYLGRTPVPLAPPVHDRTSP